MTLVHTYKLWQDWFGTDEMRQVWAEENMIVGWLEVESVLARIQAEDGTIPSEAAEKISCIKRLTPIQICAMQKITGHTRHVIVGFIRFMQEILGDAGGYFHLGVTTQDILETGLTLQIKQAIQIVERDLRRLREIIVELAILHKETVMVGRSQGQQGLPITFGFKSAIWADELNDHLVRLGEMKNRVLRVSLSAAMGTQASFTLLAGKDEALSLPPRAGKILGLSAPNIDPHHRTDRFAELGGWLALVCSTLGEIGLEIRDLQRAEVAEIREVWREGVEGSSTMVHKQNPEPCHWLEGLAKISRGNALALMDIQMQHERDATRTAALLSSIPESFLCVSSSLKIGKTLFANLQVNSGKMLENLQMTGGANLSEAIWLELFQKGCPRNQAQNLVKRVVQNSFSGGIKFCEALLEEPEVRRYLNRDDIHRLLTPENYLGTVREQIQQIVRKIQFAKRRQ